MDNALPRSTPAAEQVSAEAIREFLEALERMGGAASTMILRHGRVIAEKWWPPSGPDDVRELWSLSKSFTSSAVGLAISEGLLALDDLVVDLLPADLPAHVVARLAVLNIRHLLTMTTGHDAESLPEESREADADWAKHVLGVPLAYEPGTHFQYNSGATYLLSAIIQRLTGCTLLEYLTPRLFEPLGIRDVRWLTSPQGINTGAFGLHARTEDVARFGQLLMQRGSWHGVQVLPAEWVTEATGYQVPNGDPAAPSDWTQGYGYQFWRCRHNAFRGDGKLGQFCIVMPDRDAVVAITADIEDMQAELDLVWDYLLPAMKAS